MLNTKTLLAIAISITTFLAACSPKVSQPVAKSETPTGTNNAPATNVRYTAAQLETGHTLYTNNCGKCHKLFQPQDKSVSKWERVLPPMIRKAKLSDEQGTLVRAWVMSQMK
jgi:cytochrome c5